MRVLVIGGAGYIGSHMVKFLGRNGCRVTTLDNLSSGHRDAVLFGDFVFGDFGDTVLLDSVLSRGFDAVMHFASFIQVGESIEIPSDYYCNNLVKTLRLLDAMRRHGINKFIFSSTAATYGEPQYVPIDESHLQQPINPYGRSKLMVEWCLEDYHKAYGLKYVCLRYFNAAGADHEGQLGERHNPETHLIPLVLQVASGRRSNITVFGLDYDTADGSCIRDYVHVEDICQAHWLSLNALEGGLSCAAFNLGNGDGFSVKEIITAVESIAKKSISFVIGNRRPGDPAVLVADASLIRSTLGWRPIFSDLSVIVEHAWKWELEFFVGQR